MAMIPVPAIPKALTNLSTAPSRRRLAAFTVRTSALLSNAQAAAGALTTCTSMPSAAQL